MINSICLMKLALFLDKCYHLDSLLTCFRCIFRCQYCLYETEMCYSALLACAVSSVKFLWFWLASVYVAWSFVVKSLCDVCDSACMWLDLFLDTFQCPLFGSLCLKLTYIWYRNFFSGLNWRATWLLHLMAISSLYLGNFLLWFLISVFSVFLLPMI